jgi:hypothetical protein
MRPPFFTRLLGAQKRGCQMRYRTALVSLAILTAAALPGNDAARAQRAGETVTIAPSGYERVGSGPENLFWIRDNLSGIVDALANSVVFVDDGGRILGRAPLPDGFVVSGTDARDDSIVLISGDRSAGIALPRTLDPAAPPSLNPQPLPPAAPGAAPQTVRRAGTQLSLPAQAGRPAARPLEVRSLTGRPLAEAMEIGTDSDGRRYVLWSEFVSANPDILVRVFVGRYSPEGLLNGVAEVPLADMDYVPEGYATVTGRGELRVIVPTQQGLEIRTIPIQPIAPVSPGTTKSMVAPNLLKRLETEKGRAASIPSTIKMPGETRSPANEPQPTKQQRAALPVEPIQRGKVLELANEFLSQQWTLADKNYEHPTPPNACAKVEGRYWSRPSWIKKELIGQQLTRIPYKWGGFDSPAVFVERMTKGDLAGDVCTCRDSSHNDCIVGQAAGVDCSGFVSRAWGLKGKLGTSGLSTVSTVVRDWQSDVTRIKAGDALNKAGSHVRLAVEAVAAPQIRIMVIESTTAKTCKRRDGSVMLCEGVCECARPIADFNGYQLLRYKGIRD